MASPLLEDGIRRVSISPTNTEPDPDDMEPCATPLPMEIDERPGVRGAYEVRLPAVTPVTPPAIGLSHAQWCDKIRCQETDLEEGALIPCRVLWLVTLLHGLRLTHP